MERRQPMRRDTPGARRFAAQRSELPRGDKGLSRGKPPERSTTGVPRTRTDDPIPPKVTKALHERSGGYCEARASSYCTGVAEHRHHRKLRRHKDHTLVNLLHVCLRCHDTIHARINWSRSRGFLVRSTDDPAAVPVRPGFEG